MKSSWIVDAALYALVFMSFVSWSVFLIKAHSFWRYRRMARGFLLAHGSSPSWSAVTGSASQGHGDMARLQRTGIAICKDCDGTADTTDELYTLIAAGLGQEIKLLARERESGLSVLASISAIAPFVGLFGTVWGIMEALVVIGQTGQATIAVVAGPIGEALVATAIGIATAVPALLFYNMLMRKTRVYITDLEAFSEQFLRVALKNRQHWEHA